MQVSISAWHLFWALRENYSNLCVHSSIPDLAEANGLLGRNIASLKKCVRSRHGVKNHRGEQAVRFSEKPSVDLDESAD